VLLILFDKSEKGITLFRYFLCILILRNGEPNLHHLGCQDLECENSSSFERWLFLPSLQVQLQQPLKLFQRRLFNVYDGGQFSGNTHK
jgi:hypothetical protein